MGEGRASSGGVQFFVSPQVRCMRTADPLMRALFEKCGLTARVMPDLIEHPGLMQKADQEAFFPTYEGLLQAGRQAEAAEFRKQFKWEACGENVEDMKREFPWAVLDPAIFPETGRWYTSGWEA